MQPSSFFYSSGLGFHVAEQLLLRARGPLVAAPIACLGFQAAEQLLLQPSRTWARYRRRCLGFHAAEQLLLLSPCVAARQKVPWSRLPRSRAASSTAHRAYLAEERVVVSASTQPSSFFYAGRARRWPYPVEVSASTQPSSFFYTAPSTPAGSPVVVSASTQPSSFFYSPAAVSGSSACAVSASTQPSSFFYRRDRTEPDADFRSRLPRSRAASSTLAVRSVSRRPGSSRLPRSRAASSTVTDYSIVTTRSYSADRERL